MKYLSIAFMLSFVLFGKAQNNESLFAKGNELYTSEQYEKAIELYDSINTLGYESAELYFNTANAYYKINNLGKAILYYERAANLKPYDDDIRQNLSIANLATIDRFEEMPQPLVRSAYYAVVKALTPGLWAVLATIMLFCLIVGLAMYLYSNKRKIGFILASIGLILSLYCFTMAYAHQSYKQENRIAVVTVTNTYVKSGPSESAEDVFILHEGCKVTASDSLNSWKKIKLADGKVGWIASQDIEEI